MAQALQPNDSRGIELFPQFANLYDSITPEVNNLTDAQLNWRSDRWEWSKWPIRRQLLHIACFFPDWLIGRWGRCLGNVDFSSLGDFSEWSLSPNGPWLDEARYWKLSSILEKISQGIQLAIYILEHQSVGSMRRLTITRPNTPAHWRQFAEAHHTGVRWHPTEPITYLTLEATFRHLYYETLTHLYNIHRLKRAQRLSTITEIPWVGYWALPSWDRSEP